MGRLLQWEIDQAYNEWLDDCYGNVSIAGHAYPASKALEATDPTAYRCGLADFIDAQLSDEVWFEYSDGSIHDSPDDDSIEGRNTKRGATKCY